MNIVPDGVSFGAVRKNMFEETFPDLFNNFFAILQVVVKQVIQLFDLNTFWN